MALTPFESGAYCSFGFLQDAVRVIHHLRSRTSSPEPRRPAPSSPVAHPAETPALWAPDGAVEPALFPAGFGSFGGFRGGSGSAGSGGGGAGSGGGSSTGCSVYGESGCGEDPHSGGLGRNGGGGGCGSDCGGSTSPIGGGDQGGGSCNFDFGLSAASAAGGGGFSRPGVRRRTRPPGQGGKLPQRGRGGVNRRLSVGSEAAAAAASRPPGYLRGPGDAGAAAAAAALGPPSLGLSGLPGPLRLVLAGRDGGSSDSDWGSLRGLSRSPRSA